MSLGMYTITVHGDAPQLFIGSVIGGARVVSIKDVSPKLVSATELAEQYNLDAKTIRSKLAAINKGTRGKHLYSPAEADLLLSDRGKQKVGRKRAN